MTFVIIPLKRAILTWIDAKTIQERLAEWGMLSQMYRSTNSCLETKKNNLRPICIPLLLEGSSKVYTVFRRDKKSDYSRTVWKTWNELEVHTLTLHQRGCIRTHMNQSLHDNAYRGSLSLQLILCTYTSLACFGWSLFCMVRSFIYWVYLCCLVGRQIHSTPC